MKITAKKYLSSDTLPKSALNTRFCHAYTKKPLNSGCLAAFHFLLRKTVYHLPQNNKIIDILSKKFQEKKKPIRHRCGLVKCGGDKGIRTPGLRIANATLYQLSHIPTFAFRNIRFVPCCVIISHYLILTINF